METKNNHVDESAEMTVLAEKVSNCLEKTLKYIESTYGDAGLELINKVSVAFDDDCFIDNVLLFYDHITFNGRSVVKGEPTVERVLSVFGTMMFFDKVMKNVHVNEPSRFEEMLVAEPYLLRFFCFFYECIKFGFCYGRY